VRRVMTRGRDESPPWGAIDLVALQALEVLRPFVLCSEAFGDAEGLQRWLSHSSHSDR